MIKEIPVPYKLILVSNSWVGNFERELIGYAMGCLDDVQMEIDFAYEERAMFWKDIYNEDVPRVYFDDNDDYNLMSDFLLETYQTVDDWSQNTFYIVEGGTHIKTLKTSDSDSCIIIQLAKPLDEHWESIIIPRIKSFFENKVYSHLRDEAKIVRLCLVDANNNIIKDYLSGNSFSHICKYKKLIPVTFVSIGGIEFDYNTLCSTLEMLMDDEKINDYDFPCSTTIENLYKLGYVDFSYGSHQANLFSAKKDGSTKELFENIISLNCKEN